MSQSDPSPEPPSDLDPGFKPTLKSETDQAASKSARTAKRLKSEKLRFAFYKVVAASAIVWACTFLYFHSVNNVFGGSEKADAVRQGYRVASIAQLTALEKAHASSDVLYEKRLALALLYDDNKDYKLGRNLLLKEKDELLKEPESELNFTRRIKVEEMIAHIDMDEGLFVDARERVVRAMGLADQMSERFQSQNGTLLRLSMVNETGVIAYLEANTAPSTKVRRETFIRSQSIFEQVLAQIDSLQHDGSKWTEANEAILRDIKAHATDNLKLIIEDQKYESMFQQT